MKMDTQLVRFYLIGIPNSSAESELFLSFLRSTAYANFDECLVKLMLIRALIPHVHDGNKN